KRDLESIAWLSAIGKKPRAKARIERLESIGDWPGMDKPEIAALNDLLVSMEGDVANAARVLGKTLDSSVYDSVYDRASKVMPGFDPDADWAEPGNAAPYTVATIAQLAAH